MSLQFSRATFNKLKYPIFLLGLIVLRLGLNHVHWRTAALLGYTAIFLVLIASTTHQSVVKRAAKADQTTQQ